MNKTELAIIERIAQLDESQQQVLTFARTLVSSSASEGLSLGEWLEQAAALRAQLRGKYGSKHFFGTQALLDEIREEASWPRWS
jgi:hypothetical protein